MGSPAHHLPPYCSYNPAQSCSRTQHNEVEVGLEPTTFGSLIWGANHCATVSHNQWGTVAQCPIISGNTRNFRGGMGGGCISEGHKSKNLSKNWLIFAIFSSLSDGGGGGNCPIFPLGADIASHKIFFLAFKSLKYKGWMLISLWADSAESPSFDFCFT